MEPAEYERMARLEDGHWWYRALRRLVLRSVHASLPVGRKPRILDAGCGTGGSLAALAKSVPEAVIIGADVAQPAMTHAAARAAGHLVYGSVNRLPFRDAAFDLVLCADLLYIEGVDDRLALGEIRRVLRDDGTLIVNVAAFEVLRGAHDDAVHTRHRYRRNELERLLAAQGFAVKRLMYWNALLCPAVFLVRRVFRPGRARSQAGSDLVGIPGVLNWLLEQLLTLDGWLCSRVRMPFGTSLFTVASKRVAEAAA